MTPSTALITDLEIRLHNEIIEFYDAFGPNQLEFNNRAQVVQRVSNFICEMIPGSQVYCFGSSATGLYLACSDIDVLILHPMFHLQELIKRCEIALKDPKCPFELTNSLIHAKVPIIKLYDRESKLDVDLAFNSVEAYESVSQIKKHLNKNKELPYLIIIVKLMLKERNLNNSYYGGIGSYLLFCLFRVFIEFFKNDQKQKNGVYSILETSLASYLINFFDFYVSHFDFRSYEIILGDQLSIVPKENPDDQLSLITPDNSFRNIGHQAFRYYDVFKVFEDRVRLLKNCAIRPKESILKLLINPSSFDFKALLK